ncbi:MAG TPA: hypothetical protein VLV86_19870, partial [Vicinamibacterales bacterium]|nr:hypothetical protein [Vicinamibacterales bacterium]
MKVKQPFACAAIIGVVLCVTTASRAVHGQSPTSAPTPTTSLAGQTLGPDAERALVDKYCVTCHNARLKTGGLVLDKDAVDLTHVADRADVWEKVIRKLHGR